MTNDPPTHLPVYRCSPILAIKRFVVKWADFEGRASPSEFWWMVLVDALASVALIAIAIGLGQITSALRETEKGVGFFVGIGIYLLFRIVLVLPHIAVTVRRLHDANFSGGMYFLAFIPYVGSLVLLGCLLVRPKPAGARFDRVPFTPATNDRARPLRSIPPPPPPPAAGE